MEKQNMKALPLLLLAMSLPLFAQNPICNSSTNHDSNGNVCTNFTTASYYNPNRRPIQFDMDTQDGQAVNTDNPHSIVLDYPDYPYNVQIGIPTDPLITLGFIPSYGSPASIVYASYSSTVVSGAYGQQTYRVLYQFTGGVNTYQLQLGTDGGFRWFGTLQVTYTLTSKSCRYGRCTYYYTAGEGTGELSAIKQ
jgi:hypothetical protein